MFGTKTAQLARRSNQQGLNIAKMCAPSPIIAQTWLNIRPTWLKHASCSNTKSLSPKCFWSKLFVTFTTYNLNKGPYMPTWIILNGLRYHTRPETNTCVGMGFSREATFIKHRFQPFRVGSVGVSLVWRNWQAEIVTEPIKYGKLAIHNETYLRIICT